MSFVWSVLNCIFVPKIGRIRICNVSTLNLFTGMKPTPPISNFIRSSTSSTVSVSDMERDCSLNISFLQVKIAEFHPVVQDSGQSGPDKIRNGASRGAVPNSMEIDSVLVARDCLTAIEKLSLRWRGPRRVIKALSFFCIELKIF